MRRSTTYLTLPLSPCTTRRPTHHSVEVVIARKSRLVISGPETAYSLHSTSVGRSSGSGAPGRRRGYTLTVLFFTNLRVQSSLIGGTGVTAPGAPNSS